jgi:hypothetical protein
MREGALAIAVATAVEPAPVVHPRPPQLWFSPIGSRSGMPSGSVGVLPTATGSSSVLVAALVASLGGR